MVKTRWVIGQAESDLEQEVLEGRKNKQSKTPSLMSAEKCVGAIHATRALKPQLGTQCVPVEPTLWLVAFTVLLLESVSGMLYVKGSVF